MRAPRGDEAPLVVDADGRAAVEWRRDAGRQVVAVLAGADHEINPHVSAWVSITSLLNTRGPLPKVTSMPKASASGPKTVLPPVATTWLLRMRLPSPSTWIPA